MPWNECLVTITSERVHSTRTVLSLGQDADIMMSSSAVPFCHEEEARMEPITDLGENLANDRLPTSLAHSDRRKNGGR
jgi:hypothetical protein